MPKKISPKLTATEEQVCQETIARIAHENLVIATLQSRGSDRLDFYDLGVASIRDALLAAYLAGRESMKKHPS